MIPTISVVVPIYACASCLPELVRRLTATLKAIPGSHEIILVDDGSTDNAWKLIENIAPKDKTVKGIHFARNFGQHMAISAGVEKARGKWIVVMDGDLQDRPEEIIRLHQKATENNFDIVFARRAIRMDTFGKKLGSWIYHKIFTLLSGIKSDPAIGNFSIVSRIVIDSFKLYPERHRSYLQIIRQLGFKIGVIDVVHDKRFSGKSSYTLAKLVTHAVDVATGFSTRILSLWMFAGFIIALVSGIIAIIIIIGHFMNRFTVPGWVSVIVLTSFLSGMILSGLGVIALYLGKIFEEVKHRPLYIVEKTINLR